MAKYTLVYFTYGNEGRLSIHWFISLMETFYIWVREIQKGNYPFRVLKSIVAAVHAH